MVEHVVPDPVLLGDARTMISGTSREGLVRVGDHLDEEAEPRPGVVATVLPADGRPRQGVVIGVASFVDEPLEGDITPDAIADLGEQARAEQARESPIAVDERVNREEVECEQSHEQRTVVAPRALFSAIPIDELGHEEGRVLVRRRDEPNTRGPVGVPVHNEVVDGLELPPSATRPTKEESV